MKKRLRLKKDAYLIIIIFVIVVLSISGFIYAFLKFKPVDKCLEITNEKVLVEINETYEYSFKIKNRCNKRQISISLETFSNSFIKEDGLLVDNQILSSYPAVIKTLDESISSHLIKSDVLDKDEEKDYKIKLDINEGDNGSYEGEIVAK